MLPTPPTPPIHCMRTSVFTACTPWLPLAELIPAVAAAGYGGIEIGLHDRQWDKTKPGQFWSNNPAMLDYAQALDEAAELARVLTASRLPCIGIGAYATAWDRVHHDTCFAVAAHLRAGLLRIRAPGYDAKRPYGEQWMDLRAIYRDLGQRAQAEGTRVVIELHDHSLCPSPSAALRVLEGSDPRGLGVIFEPANMIKEGWEAMPQAIASLGPYLAHVHVKDVRADIQQLPAEHRRWQWSFVPLGTGLLDWPGIVQAVQAAHYDGWWSIENFSGAEEGLARLAKDQAWLAQVLAAAQPDKRA